MNYAREKTEQQGAHQGEPGQWEGEVACPAGLLRGSGTGDFSTAQVGVKLKAENKEN